VRVGGRGPVWRGELPVRFVEIRESKIAVGRLICDVPLDRALAPIHARLPANLRRMTSSASSSSVKASPRSGPLRREVC